MRLVLLGISNRAREDGTKAFPGIAEPARGACCSERHTQRLLRKLEKEGRIRAVSHAKGRGHATEYEVNLSMLGGKLAEERRSDVTVSGQETTTSRTQRATSRGQERVISGRHPNVLKRPYNVKGGSAHILGWRAAITRGSGRAAQPGGKSLARPAPVETSGSEVYALFRQAAAALPDDDDA